MTTKKRGRPTMPPAEKKQPFATKLAPDMVARLEELKVLKYDKAKVVDRALRELLAYWP